mmetsp:Transcript_20514/g.59509  ORF Transcript_20514/g.59509 Transcript_20514/m.59509 type:complete len:659 (-) Transcript_20514:44-2020(-)
MGLNLNRSTRDNLRKFVLAALLYYARNLWRLSSFANIAATASSSNGASGDFTAGNAIEDVAKGSQFGLPGVRVSDEESSAAAAVAAESRGGKDRSSLLPSLTQIDEAAVVWKRGTKVYLDYLRPYGARGGDEELTAAIVVSIAELRQIFGRRDSDRPPWAGPISCAIQVSQIKEDIEAISVIVKENPVAFERTSVHLLLSEAMMVVDWSSAWTVAIKASRTDLVVAISDPGTSLTEQLDEVSSTVEQHYVQSLKLQKIIIRIGTGTGNGDKSDSLLFSKRGGLLPMPAADSKTRNGSIMEWTEQLRGDGFDVDVMSWSDLASKDVAVHEMKSKPALLEMGSMYVAGLNEMVQGSVDLPRNLKAFTNFIAPRSTFASDYDVSLVTQMTFDKRERLVKLASAWGGVMSVAVFLSLPQVEDLVRFVRNNHFILRYCSFHLVIYESMNALYPINIIRNVASDAAETDYIFTVDIDFMPSLASHDTIQSYLTDPFWGGQVRGARAAMVVPAFEYTVSNRPEAELFGSLPLTKTELVRSNDVKPFHLDLFFAGQKPTDYERWYKAEQPYEVQFEEKYEPYVVLCARGHSLVPRYWDGFIGYRTNKASWIKELSRAGWRFYVMTGGAFVIHMYHDISSRPTMRLGKLYDMEAKFNNYLKERYAGT